MGTPTTTTPDDNLFRSLSNAFLINSATFAAAGPTKQTEVLAQTGVKNVLFVESFAQLRNPAALRDALLSGKDISTELEFNGLALSRDDLAALAAVRPILEKIDGLGPSYQWLPEKDFSSTICIGAINIRRGNYSMKKAEVLKVWDRASRYWSGGPKPTPHMVKVGQYDSRQASYTKPAVDVGCQSISREEIEFIARRLNWPASVFIG